MTRPRLRAEDVKIFTDAALGFFAQTTGNRANVRTAYLMDHDAPAVWSDFHGRIDLGGRYRGNVTFAAPRALISGGADTADAKLAIMEECGFTVTRNPSEMGKLLKAML